MVDWGWDWDMEDWDKVDWGIIYIFCHVQLSCRVVQLKTTISMASF